MHREAQTKTTFKATILHLLQLTYHAFGSDELQALCEGDKQGLSSPPRQLHTQDSEAVRFLKGGVLYVHLIKAIGISSKPKYKGGFMTSRMCALLTCFTLDYVILVLCCMIGSLWLLASPASPSIRVAS